MYCCRKQRCFESTYNACCSHAEHWVIKRVLLTIIQNSNVCPQLHAAQIGPQLLQGQSTSLVASLMLIANFCIAVPFSAPLHVAEAFTHLCTAAIQACLLVSVLVQYRIGL